MMLVYQAQAGGAGGRKEVEGAMSKLEVEAAADDDDDDDEEEEEKLSAPKVGR